MRTLIVVVSLIALLSGQIGFAADIDYKLHQFELSECAQSAPAQPFSEVIKDRVWAAGGIEERVINERANCCLNDVGPRIKFEFRPQECHVSYSMLDPEVRAPDWIGDALWPRTKEVLHYRNGPPRELQKTEVVLFLGPPVYTNTFFTDGGCR
jgi:hypothetical protein